MTILKAWFPAAVALCLAANAQAQVTVTGGTVTVSASAGSNAPGYVYQSDTPASVNVSASGTTTLTASATGTAPNALTGGTGTANSAATGTVSLQSTASGTTATLYSVSTGNGVDQGTAQYEYANSSAAETLFLTLTQPETVSVALTVPGPPGPGNDGQATIETAGGSVLFTGFGAGGPQNTNLSLTPGQYELMVTSKLVTPQQFPDSNVNMQVTFPAPVPLPGSLSLLGSALVLLLLGGRARSGTSRGAARLFATGET